MNMHSITTINDAIAPTWDDLLADRNAAKQAYDLHHSAVWEPLHQELKRTTPRPDLQFEIEALSGQVARYSVSPNDLHAWDDHWSPLYRRKAGEVRDAWLAYRAQYESLGLAAASDECDRLCDVQCGLEDQLFETPAPHLAALMWKFDQLFGAEAMGDGDFSPAWCARWIVTLMDDARRLLGTPTTC